MSATPRFARPPTGHEPSESDPNAMARRGRCKVCISVVLREVGAAAAWDEGSALVKVGCVWGDASLPGAADYWSVCFGNHGTAGTD